LVIGMAVLNLVKNNTEFSAQHPYNTKVKKIKKIHSIIKLCGKLSRILVAMTNQDQSYIPEKFTVMPLAAKLTTFTLRKLAYSQELRQRKHGVPNNFFFKGLDPLSHGRENRQGESGEYVQDKQCDREEFFILLFPHAPILSTTPCYERVLAPNAFQAYPRI